MKKQRKTQLLLCLAAVAIAVFVIPPAVLLAVIFQHVDYGTGGVLKDVHTPERYGLEAEIHTLETQDGEHIWCAEISEEDPRGVIIFLTGITKPSVTQFYGHSAWLKELGYASFLTEVRAHGNSSGDQVGLGYTEVGDVRAVVELIGQRPEYRDVPIVIWGVSMGGAIAINAFGQLPEIDGCIAMSPYASFEQEIELTMVQYGVPAPLRRIEQALLRAILSRIYGQETVETLKPEVQIQNACGRPLLLAASTRDRTVPVGNTERLREKAPEATVWLRQSGDHFVVKGNSFSDVKSDTEYCDFMEKWLKDAGF